VCVLRAAAPTRNAMTVERCGDQSSQVAADTLRHAHDKDAAIDLGQQPARIHGTSGAQTGRQIDTSKQALVIDMRWQAAQGCRFGQQRCYELQPQLTGRTAISTDHYPTHGEWIERETTRCEQRIGCAARSASTRQFNQAKSPAR
jgi:fructosamine-3-kinase